MCLNRKGKGYLIGVEPFFEDRGSLCTDDGILLAGGLQDNLYPTFGIGQHFINGVQADDELPVNSEKLVCG